MKTVSCGELGRQRRRLRLRPWRWMVARSGVGQQNKSRTPASGTSACRPCPLRRRPRLQGPATGTRRGLAE
uniref:Uncharacterized protein n=1 Tax=Arundo donax TaxID=35708 RepID=A0A0A8YQ77_ARUDO